MLSGFLLFGSNRMPLVQIVDPKLASYGVENPIFAVIQLAQTTMRSELGKITLDKTFEERDTLNEKIVVSLINSSYLEHTLFEFSVLVSMIETYDSNEFKHVKNTTDTMKNTI
jgi:hypothetical protein